jgi:hypothetical protein
LNENAMAERPDSNTPEAEGDVELPDEEQEAGHGDRHDEAGVRQADRRHEPTQTE